MTGPVPRCPRLARQRQLIRPVESPREAPAVPEQAPAPPTARPTAGKDFATLHAAAVAKTSTTEGTGGTAAAKTYPHYPRIPEGETWASVKPGAHYAHILTGPREGQYINLTRNGELRNHVFTIEQRDGKEVHVYSSDGDNVTVEAALDHGEATTNPETVKNRGSDQPLSGEVWEPVRGHRYADIIGGPRNGMYVNTQGGPRDGMAFQIVKQGDKVFHVYGTGKDREVLQVDGERTGIPTSLLNRASASTESGAGSANVGPEEAADKRAVAPAASRARVAVPAAAAGAALAPGSPVRTTNGAVTPDASVVSTASAGDRAAAALWDGSAMLGALIDPAADSRARSRTEDESAESS
jgi:hypothetical protein